MLVRELRSIAVVSFSTSVAALLALAPAALGGASTGPGDGPALLIAPDAGWPSELRVTPIQPARPGTLLNPFPSAFQGGVRVASGDLNGDGAADIVVGSGPGAGPHVRTFDGRNGQQLLSFFAYEAGFTRGVNVATGDVNGDGSADIVVGTGNGPAHVKVFDGRTSAQLASFFAFEAGFTGGVNVGAGDVNGDGRDDIVVGAAGGAAHVKVFDGATLNELSSFFPFPSPFVGGVNVATGDVNGDGRADLIVGGGSGAPGGHVKVFSGSTGTELLSFFAFETSFTGGVRVASGDVSGDGRSDLIVGAGPGPLDGQPHVKVFDGATGAELASFFAFGAATNPGVFVGSHTLSAPLPCPGDADGNQIVNFSDITATLSSLGTACR